MTHMSEIVKSGFVAFFVRVSERCVVGLRNVELSIDVIIVWL